MNNRGLLEKLILAGISACLLLASTGRFVRAQSSDTAADWEKAAGGKMSFEAASVKNNLAGYPPEGPKPHSNFPLDSYDQYSPNGGLFSATNWPVYVFIGFAYKAMPYEQNPMRQQLPKWASTEHFDIEARAKGNPTKDQMRLMMQALLEQRFGLVAHYETRQVPVYALVLVKPETLGPRLQPHAEDLPCTVLNSSPGSITANGNTEIPFCGLLTGMLESGRVHVSTRGTSMAQIASDVIDGMGGLDRPVVDSTGIVGTFDLNLDFVRASSNGQRGGLAANQPDFQPDPTAPTFLEGLRDELGLKLEPSTAKLPFLVIDHIKEPTPN